ncbi:hypothetical protein H2198_010073 [Neophaeococcomyces mojaviensis]|uniref:Uncharacterized protein n=1 Tax=Neophaeococcomyces mojaviensis TaxID=3383035 RepID=A0ACC2ZT05_9EURO|nr:hypothetical protein H2198_010073 [Knufia sp. JES_112]
MTSSPPLTPAGTPLDSREHQLLVPPKPTLTPLIICFHGSGSNPLPSWDILVAILSKTYRVLLYDRGPKNPSPEEDLPAMKAYLKSKGLESRYILVAHSYGGAFAKLFLHRHSQEVAGMVLVETGQEGGLSEKVRRELTKRCMLGDLPLVVIRGNSMIRQWKELEESEAAMASATEEEKDRMKTRRAWLDAADLEDEKLKKAQLGISKNGKYLCLPDCGHDVIRARPEVVAEEVRWVIEQVRFQKRKKCPASEVSIWQTWKEFFWKRG